MAESALASQRGQSNGTVRCLLQGTLPEATPCANVHSPLCNKELIRPWFRTVTASKFVTQILLNFTVSQFRYHEAALGTAALVWSAMVCY
jgi:hypothetical protein